MDQEFVTRVSTALTRVEQGEPRAMEELFPLVYDSLRERAGNLLRNERQGHTLQATALVNEAYLKLLHSSDVELQDPGHLQALSVRAMRQILVDHARRKRAQKRGGDLVQFAFDDQAHSPPGELEGIDLLELEDLLQALAELDERKARVAELKLFGGMTMPRIGTVLEISPKTVEADWYFARAWLRSQLRGP